MSRQDRYRRVLAIDPTSKGFGFVVLESTETLVDWGVAYLTPVSLKEFETRIAKMLDAYEPLTCLAFLVQS